MGIGSFMILQEGSKTLDYTISVINTTESILSNRVRH